MAGRLHIGTEAAIEQPSFEDCSAAPQNTSRAVFGDLLTEHG